MSRREAGHHTKGRTFWPMPNPVCEALPGAALRQSAHRRLPGKAPAFPISQSIAHLLPGVSPAHPGKPSRPLPRSPRGSPGPTPWTPRSPQPAVSKPRGRPDHPGRRPDRRCYPVRRPSRRGRLGQRGTQRPGRRTGHHGRPAPAPRRRRQATPRRQFASVGPDRRRKARPGTMPSRNHPLWPIPSPGRQTSSRRVSARSDSSRHSPQTPPRDPLPGGVLRLALPNRPRSRLRLDEAARHPLY